MPENNDHNYNVYHLNAFSQDVEFNGLGMV